MRIATILLYGVAFPLINAFWINSNKSNFVTFGHRRRHWIGGQHQFMSDPTATKDSSSSSTTSSFRLGYVTDVEGNLDYFLSYVHQSTVLSTVDDIYDSNERQQQQHLQLELNDPEHSYFVFGGDAVDKGPGDIRLVRALVDLKRRYPTRVFLLVGNRDLNKVRLTAELSAEDMDRPIDEIPPPHWDLKAPTLREYLERIIEDEKARQKEQKDSTTPRSIQSLNTRVRRLHYMLEKTLGCPNTFEFRRQELSLLQNRDLQDITDEEVVENFLYEIEQGSLYEYLSVANVAVVVGNTLFCHGAVDRRTMQFVPSTTTRFESPKSKPPAATMASTVEDWVEGLNLYLQEGLKDYKARPKWDSDRTTRGGESLLALQNRAAMWGRSIVSNCYGDGGCITTANTAQVRNDPNRIASEDFDALAFNRVCSDPADPVVAEWLSSNGIQRVVVGHKPTGDCPSVLSAVHTGVEIVSADTSFSDTSAVDKRGCAHCSVELCGSSPLDNRLRLVGTLRDGRSYDCEFHRLYPGGGIDGTVGDPHLGRQVRDGWWVKASTKAAREVDGDEDAEKCYDYWLTRGKGRFVEYKCIEASKLRDWMISPHKRC